jgi:hypothetical protein
MYFAAQEIQVLYSKFEKNITVIEVDFLKQEFIRRT